MTETTGRVQRLRAEIRADLEAFRRHLGELRALSLEPNPTPGDLARAAVALHHGYSALESLMIRIARTLEGSLPEGADWHQALLESMALDLDSIRPAVLSPQTVTHLRRLLGFRHFFRHAYSVSLDSARLAALRDDAEQAEPLLVADLDRLDDFLQELLAGT